MHYDHFFSCSFQEFEDQDWGLSSRPSGIRYREAQISMPPVQEGQEWPFWLLQGMLTKESVGPAKSSIQQNGVSPLGIF